MLQVTITGKIVQTQNPNLPNSDASYGWVLLEVNQYDQGSPVKEYWYIRLEPATFKKHERLFAIGKFCGFTGFRVLPAFNDQPNAHAPNFTLVSNYAFIL